jgi:dihydrofolate reductase
MNMGELTLTTFLTLDGIMQAPGGPTEDPSGDFPYGGWLVPHASPDTGGAVIDNIAKAGAFLLGRGTYDIFAGHWPKIDDPNHPIAAKLNTLPKYVASRTAKKFDWRQSSHVADVVNDIEGLKARTDGELQVHGSAGLAQTLIEHDLIDEYRLFLFPVVIGKGKRLFGAGAVPANLTLVSTKATGKGAIISVYRRGGAFKSGSFELS